MLRIKLIRKIKIIMIGYRTRMFRKLILPRTASRTEFESLIFQ